MSSLKQAEETLLFHCFCVCDISCSVQVSACVEHYCYTYIKINSLTTNKIEYFGLRALNTTEVMGDANFVDLEKFGAGDVVKSRVMDMEPCLDENNSFY